MKKAARAGHPDCWRSRRCPLKGNHPSRRKARKHLRHAGNRRKYETPRVASLPRRHSLPAVADERRGQGGTSLTRPAPRGWSWTFRPGSRRGGTPRALCCRPQRRLLAARAGGDFQATAIAAALFINGHPPAKPDTQLVPVRCAIPQAALFS